MNQLPLVSVIIPTYRRAEYLKRAIDSVLVQTYPSLEVLVIDDNNPETDYRRKTEQLMTKYEDEKRIRYICHPENRNGAAARNTGLRNAQGEWCCFLDDDDWYLPQKIEKQVDFLLENKEYNAVYCGYERNGKIIHPYKQGDLSFELLSGVEVIYTNTIMIKRSEALSCGGWDERFRRNQEAVFLLRYFSQNGKIGAIPDLLVHFDTTDDSNRSKPVQFEEDFKFFLKTHQPEIIRCQQRYSNAKELIYSYRYRGIFLNYLKHGYLKHALRFYREASCEYPRRFFHDCITYFKRRILKEDIFKEYR